MQNIIRCFAATAIIAVGFMMQPAKVHAVEAAVHGCWYYPPNPPACDECSDSCADDQVCCSITIIKM